MHHNEIMTRNQSREKHVARWLERLDAKRVSSIYESSQIFRDWEYIRIITVQYEMFTN